MEQHTYTIGIYFRISLGNGIPTIPLVTMSQKNGLVGWAYHAFVTQRYSHAAKMRSKMYVENNYLQISVTYPYRCLHGASYIMQYRFYVLCFS